MRQIVLDTETTGLDPTKGHRIIEIGCVEIVDRQLTGDHFHTYLNPERDIEEGAQAVHGITQAFLADKPRFKDIVEKWLAYVKGAELIIHNAPFDVGFLDAELQRLNAGYAAVSEVCTLFDTLVLARKLHPGRRNSLDALCERYHIDNSKREVHGALLDAQLAGQVYLAMTHGQTTLFGEETKSPLAPLLQRGESTAPPFEEGRNHQAPPFVEGRISSSSPAHAALKIIRATLEENAAHEAYLKKLKEHTDEK